MFRRRRSWSRAHPYPVPRILDHTTGACLSDVVLAEQFTIWSGIMENALLERGIYRLHCLRDARERATIRSLACLSHDISFMDAYVLQN